MKAKVRPTVYSIRDPGAGQPGGWSRVVNNQRGPEFHADSILIKFMTGTPLAGLADSYMLALETIEAVIRWYLHHPDVMRKVMGKR